MNNNQDTTKPEWLKNFKRIITTSAEEAVKKISPGHRVFIGTATSQPTRLVNAMAARANELVDVEIFQLVFLKRFGNGNEGCFEARENYLRFGITKANVYFK